VYHTARLALRTRALTIVYPSKQVREGALEMPIESGMSDSFDRLDAVLATMV